MEPGCTPVVTNSFVFFRNCVIQNKTNEFVTTGVRRVPFKMTWLNGNGFEDRAEAIHWLTRQTCEDPGSLSDVRSNDETALATKSEKVARRNLGRN